MVAGKSPTLRLERKLWAAGDEVVIGLDEVGRGAWAGVVSVGAVVAPNEHLKGVRDSKLLREADRDALVPDIQSWALAYGVGHASHLECDHLGMTSALRLAAERALEVVAAQGFKPDRVILDGKHNYLGPGVKVTTVIKGDQTVLSCAAASVLAKVERDAMMVEEAEHFPQYGFDANRGYPAPAHRTALEGYGPCSIHRRSWVFMDNLLWPHMKYERQPSLFG